MANMMSLVDTKVSDSCLFFRVLDHCDIRSIRSVCQTCILFSAAVDVYETEAWDISRFFKTWFSSSDDFRSVLRDSDALVYGPAVLKYLERSRSSSILNVLVGLEGLSIMGNWIERSGYTLTAWSSDYPTQMRSPPPGFGDIHRRILMQQHNVSNRLSTESLGYIHFRKRSNTTVEVRVTITQNDPFFPVLHTNTTADMNFMTFDRATCLFPALTFVRRIALSRCKGTDIDGNALDWVSALRNEGYEVPIPPGDDIAGYIPGVNSVRHVRDSFCWHIHFGDHPPDHLHRRRPVNSLTLKRKTFEVLDWKLANVKLGIYIAVGEEFELSSAAFIEGKCAQWDFGVPGWVLPQTA